MGWPHGTVLWGGEKDSPNGQKCIHKDPKWGKVAPSSEPRSIQKLVLPGA